MDQLTTLWTHVPWSVICYCGHALGEPRTWGAGVVFFVVDDVADDDDGDN